MKQTIYGIAFLVWGSLVVSQEASATTYTEGADLSLNLAAPTDLGTFSNGINAISGNVSTTCLFFGGNNCVLDGDPADSFKWFVPVGLEVTQFELIISNFSSSEGSFAARHRTFSGGTTISFFGADGTFANILSGGPLSTGTYDFQLLSTGFNCTGVFPNPTCTGNEFTTFDWTANITLSKVAAVPIPPAVWLFGSALGVMGWMRRKAAA
jgi:hypothetical protein